MGRHNKMETKTGTMPEVNQKRAGRIKAITGVDLIRASGKSRKAAKVCESAARSPRKKPAIREIMKERRTLKKLNAKACQKRTVAASSKSLNKTECG